jgi:hypothetical protein
LESRFGNSFIYLWVALYGDSRRRLRPHRSVQNSPGALSGKGIATAGLILGYIGLALGILGIPLLASMIQSERERLHHLAIERKEIASDDGKLKVTTSGLWVKRSDLNKEASLQAAYKDKEMYVIVITDAKAGLDNFTLENIIS